MSDRHAARLDFGQLIAAVENAPPVAAVEVLGARMTEALGARAVSFLIADFSGQASIRLGHAASEAAGRTQGRETAERVPLTGSPQGRAIATQTVEVQSAGGEARVFAPVTNRGEAIGVLEVTLLDIPDEQTVADSRWPRTAGVRRDRESALRCTRARPCSICLRSSSRPLTANFATTRQRSALTGTAGLLIREPPTPAPTPTPERACS